MLPTISKLTLLAMCIGGIAVGLWCYVRDDPAWDTLVEVGGSKFRMRRTVNGVIEFWGHHELDVFRGLGYAHARDRAVQMFFTRTIAQGRLSEIVDGSDEMLKVDTFMREQGFARTARAVANELTPVVAARLNAYCDGVNTYMAANHRPLELIMIGLDPVVEPWTPVDVLLITQLMGFVGLAETQIDLERLLIQSVQSGVPLSALQKLFPPHLDAVDPAIVHLLQKVAPVHFFPPEVAMMPALPTFKASNNWVVSGQHTKSGKPLMAMDPHLEVSRLPAVWYEVLYHSDPLANNSIAGISVPGIPAVIMGRRHDVAFSLTYGFMDMADFFVEEIRNGSAVRDTGNVAFTAREETILRKNGSPATVTFFESGYEILEAPSNKGSVLQDGFYLGRCYSGFRGHRLVESLDQLSGLLVDWQELSVLDLQQRLRVAAMSANLLLADRRGSIGYQQTGVQPARVGSGLFPLDGRVAANHWQAAPVDPARLLSRKDPSTGILVTANNDFAPAAGSPLAINAHMGNVRKGRIEHVLSTLLDNKSKLAASHMSAIQCDVTSDLAAQYLRLLRPLFADLPPSPALVSLRDWDLRYTTESVGATVFEHVLWQIRDAVFGKLFGIAAWHSLKSFAVMAEFVHYFDAIILSDSPSVLRPWMDDVAGREALLQRVLRDTFGNTTLVSHLASAPYGESRRFTMANIVLGELGLPSWTGVNVNAQLPGSRDTINQGSLFIQHGRPSGFAPSWRAIADLGDLQLATVLPGGPSGRFASNLYTADVKAYFSCGLKTLNLQFKE